jgi:iron only hydrogenase large subunit-like protein
MIGKRRDRMQTFSSLYERLMKAGVGKRLDAEIANLNADGACDPVQLDCLLKPKLYPPVVRLGQCSCSPEDRAKCGKVCFFSAITHDEHGNAVISRENCIGCGDCMIACERNNLAEIKEAVPMFGVINEGKSPVYAMIAPAYISQFSEKVTPGKLRSAFKRLGFAGMIEVALFADILTLKEALEFDKAIRTDRDFMLTSCCCPMWIAMIKKVYRTLVPHLPPSVSPMVACAKAIKALYPGATTVFVGPCIAKKAEAREQDIADAVDYVLTFEEIRDILDAAAIDPAALEEDVRDHSSRAGIRYAVTSGVSDAVRSTLNKLRPDRQIPLKAEHADGVRACKEMLKSILEGTVRANFIEGMGCVGGCVGGPKSLIDRNDAARNVNEYGGKALFETPAENPFVIELLEKLGFDTIESLLEGDSLFIRNFDV